jgi:L-seryl-tRNA(Ser) seleniumtransferase
VYDIGSGFIRDPATSMLPDEPDVRSAIEVGADLACFSCDKLFGGPQAGVIAGRADLVRCLAKAPLMRALRVGKLTLAALEATCRRHISRDQTCPAEATQTLLRRTLAELRQRAERMVAALAARGIAAETVRSEGRYGGGTSPDYVKESVGIELTPPPGSAREKERFAERRYHALMHRQEMPIVAVLREGRLVFDMLTIFDDEEGHIVDALAALNVS